MSQTTWIVGGGALLIAAAIGLYVLSGQATIDSSRLPAQETSVNTTNTSPSAVIHTSMGAMTVKLLPSDAPKTVENFTKLSREGFYSGVKFHRVIKGFMNQTGDPLTKDDSMADRWGTGNPGYRFEDEIDPSSALYERGYKRGVVAMANSGPNTNGSQFFIMAADYPLPPSYTIFGEVTEGLDVVAAINNVETDGPAQLGGHDRPLTPVVITSVEIK